MTLWQLTLLVVCVSVEVYCQQAPTDFTAQYHVQTDLGTNRFFRFQTHSGQYRKEKLNHDGSVEGTYGWVDPAGLLRLFDYVADNSGYRIEKEYLYQLGPPSPAGIIATRGGDINIGFEVYPLDGGAPVDRQSGGVALRVNLPEKRLDSVAPYHVSSLVSTDHHLDPNPVSLQAQATFFSGEPAPPPPRRIVVGATEVAEPRREPEPSFSVIGHTGRTLPEPEAPARSTGIVIGLSHNDEISAPARPAVSRSAPRPAARGSGIVIGSSRRRRFALF